LFFSVSPIKIIFFGGSYLGITPIFIFKNLNYSFDCKNIGLYCQKKGL